MRAWVWWVVVGAVVGARELDPASCSARFDVQRDKIIRTEESREMGARYLSELDVGARTECLRLCCETDACDVFVFEEKSPGSCYLFSCGPPEDFRCKFTAHGNFSSGVLALSRRLAELQDSERLANHERELANLRNPTSTTVTTTLAVHSTESPPAPPQPTAMRCSRYQFECRHGGECIAVYNACDGVPQCADGSDEAPELDCPSSPAPPVPLPPARPPQLAAPRPGPTAASATRAPPLAPLTQVLAESGFAAAAGGEAAGGEAAGGEATGGEATGGEVAEVEAAGGMDQWPRRLAQAQPHRYTGGVSGMGGSHIFSHKGGLLQPERESAFEAVPPAGWPRRAWQTLPGPGVDTESERGWGGYGREWPDVEPRRAWPVPRQETDMQMYIPSKTMPEMPLVYSSQQQTLRDGPKKGFEILNKNIMEFPTEPPPHRIPAPGPGDHRVDTMEENRLIVIENTTKKKALKSIKADSNDEAGHAGSGSHVPSPRGKAAGAGEGVREGVREGAGAAAALEARARWPNDDHDGLSERPPAAVLLLVLGSLLTACLVALAGCRARAARRRRRAHPRLALDADYLVNGMYL